MKKLLVVGWVFCLCVELILSFETRRLFRKETNWLQWVQRAKYQHESDIKLFFRKQSESEENGVTNFGKRRPKTNKNPLTWIQKAKKFLPDLYQSWFRKKKSVLHPKGGTEQKFHVQLVIDHFDQREDVLRGIQLVLPDIGSQTAKEIVDEAFLHGKFVLRVFESKERATGLIDLLRQLDPPIHAELYDFKNQETID